MHLNYRPVGLIHRIAKLQSEKFKYAFLVTICCFSLLNIFLIVSTDRKINQQNLPTIENPKYVPPSIISNGAASSMVAFPGSRGRLSTVRACVMVLIRFSQRILIRSRNCLVGDVPMCNCTIEKHLGVTGCFQTRKIILCFAWGRLTDDIRGVVRVKVALRGGPGMTIADAGEI